MALFSHSTPLPLSQKHGRQDLDELAVSSDFFFPNDETSTLDQQVKFYLLCNESLGSYTASEVATMAYECDHTVTQKSC